MSEFRPSDVVSDSAQSYVSHLTQAVPLIRNKVASPTGTVHLKTNTQNCLTILIGLWNFCFLIPPIDEVRVFSLQTIIIQL